MCIVQSISSSRARSFAFIPQRVDARFHVGLRHQSRDVDSQVLITRHAGIAEVQKSDRVVPAERGGEAEDEVPGVLRRVGCPARLATHARIMTRREMSGPVAGVDPDIAFRQVAGPEARRALAFSADGKPDFAIARVQFRLQFGLGERRGEPAAADQQRPAYGYRSCAGSKATPALPAADRMRPQFGSEPAIAVFTSGELAMARAMRGCRIVRRRAGDLDGDQLARALAIARDLPAPASPSRRRWPLPPAAVPWDRAARRNAPLASSSSVSLVEVSPSTESRL